MADEDAFRAAVVAAPHEDGPRLVYADWLEERGNPAGEFIRVQVKLARLGPGRETVRLAGCARVPELDRPDQFYGTLLGRDGHGPLRGKRVDVVAVSAMWRLPPGERQIDEAVIWDCVVIAAHGESIRFRSAGGTSDSHCERRRELKRRASELRRYRAVRRHLALPKGFRAERVQRGFVAGTSARVADFLAGAADLFRAAPVEAVRLIDREPLDADHCEFAWVIPEDRGDLGRPEALSDKLFRLLPGGEPVAVTADGPVLARRYRTRGAALGALSAACVLFGRVEAGLAPTHEHP